MGRFYKCMSLKSTVLPASITNIESHAFSWCDNLSNLTYYGNSSITNDIGLPENTSIYVVTGYPYSAFGGRPVTEYISNQTVPPSSQAKSNKLLIVGIVSGVIVLCCIITGALTCLRRKDDSKYTVNILFIENTTQVSK